MKPIVVRKSVSASYVVLSVVLSCCLRVSCTSVLQETFNSPLEQAIVLSDVVEATETDAGMPQGEECGSVSFNLCD